MNLLDNLLLGFNTITEGLENLLVNEDYIFVSNKDGKILCTVYNNDEGRVLLERYMEEQDFSKDDVSVSVLDTLESEDLEEIFKSHQLT